VRGTLLASSVRALQTRGDFERYLRVLPTRYHETMTLMVAAQWVPYEVGEAHYRACNALGFGPRDFEAMGRDVGHRINDTVLSTFVKLAKGSGVSPWTSLSNFGRLWGRIFVGGALGVRKLGPKEALVEVVGQGLVSIPYYHAAQRVLFLALLELFCTKAYGYDVPRADTPTGATYRFSWV
jgi:hypothetical protein